MNCYVKFLCLITFASVGSVVDVHDGFTKVSKQRHHPNKIREDRSKRFLHNHPYPDQKSLRPGDPDWTRLDQSMINQKRDENLCSLYIYTDPFLWNHVLKMEGNNATLAYIRIRRLLDRSVLHANKVFGVAEFYGRGMKIYKGIKFKLKEYKIDNGENCEERIKQTPKNFFETECEEMGHYTMTDLCCITPTCKKNNHNIYCNDIRSMRFYLHAFSMQNHSEYCLAYAFTFRDMQDFQGIAWIKGHDPNETTSVKYYGYCAENDQVCIESSSHLKNATNFTSHNFYYRNTGVINLHFLNTESYSEDNAINIFTHELGHSFGAKHDDQVAECNPHGDDTFLMTGVSKKVLLHQNKHQLSACSNREIGFNLDLVKYWKPEVYQESNQSFDALSKICDLSPVNLSSCSTISSNTVAQVSIISGIALGCLGIILVFLSMLKCLNVERICTRSHASERNMLTANFCENCKHSLIKGSVCKADRKPSRPTFA